MEKKSIGKFIALLRKANGYTQEELASLLNVSNKTISSWENDNSSPDLSLIVVLADIFHVSCDELLRGEKDSSSNEIFSKKSEKIKTYLYSSLLTNFRNAQIISLALLGVGVLLSIIGIFIDIYWLMILLLILGIVAYIAGLVFIVVYHNNVELKNDKENVGVNRRILEQFAFIKSIYSLFILTPLFYHSLNKKLLTQEDYKLEDNEQVILKKNKKLKRIIYIPTLIIMGILLVVGIALTFVNLDYFGTKYTKDEIIEREYTFTIEHKSSTHFIQITNAAGFRMNMFYSIDKFTEEDLAKLDEIPTGEVRFNLFSGSPSEYVENEVCDNQFTIQYKLNSATVLYGKTELLELEKYTIEDEFCYFSANRNEYISTFSDKYVLRGNNVVKHSNLFLTAICASTILYLAVNVGFIVIRKKID